MDFFPIPHLYCLYFTLDGDTSNGRWYVTEHINPKEGDTNLTLGVYDDKYTKKDGKWLFSERRYHVMYQGAGDYSGPYNPYPG